MLQSGHLRAAARAGEGLRSPVIWYGAPSAKLAIVTSELRAAIGADDETTATALAVFLLRRLFPDDEEQWRLTADKAEVWLASRGLRGGPSELWSALDQAMAWWTPGEQIPF